MYYGKYTQLYTKILSKYHPVSINNIEKITGEYTKTGETLSGSTVLDKFRTGAFKKGVQREQTDGKDTVKHGKF